MVGANGAANCGMDAAAPPREDGATTHARAVKETENRRGGVRPWQAACNREGRGVIGTEARGCVV